jgi:hypothetical protein
MGVQNVEQFERSYSFIVLYFIHNYMHTYYFIHNYKHTYRIVEWYVQHSCYIMLRSNVYTPLKKIIRRRRQAHHVPNIAHCKLLLWSDENTVFSGKSFNAVSLAVPNTWPLNCAHIILILSAESPCDISLTYCCFMSRSYSVGSPNMFDNQ